MLNRFYESCLFRLRDHMEAFKQTVITGHARSFEDYRFICGNIKGLEEAEAIIRDLFDEAQEGRITIKSSIKTIRENDE